MLFHDFLILTIDDDANGVPSQPQVGWRMDKNNKMEVNDMEIAQFCYPYPELLTKTTARSALPADEFVFVLSKAGGEGDSAAISRTFGFCRRCIGPGIKDRHDLGLRYPECLCLLSNQPLFSLFPAILKAAHGLRLLEQPDKLYEFIQRVQSPSPFPLSGETFRIPIKTYLTDYGVPSDLCFKMPAFTDSSMFGDVGIAALLHCLGPRKYLLFLIALLSERRIIMVASSLRKLTRCMHCAIAALQPFSWQHIFIPLLPSKLLSYACAPYPYLIGLHASHLADILDPEGELPLSEVLVVDLDKGDMHVVGSRVGDDGPPLIRDVIGVGIMTSQHAVRRGADKLDVLRVRATRYLASRLEMITPVEIASTVETFSEKTADAAASLSERLHSITSSSSGKTPSWHIAKSTEPDGVGVIDAEATPSWTAKGSPGEVRRPSSNTTHQPSYTPGTTHVLNGIGSDDFALAEALLVFFLQIVGDPEPFIMSKLRRPSIISNDDGRGPGSVELDALRMKYLASRKEYRSSQGIKDSIGLTGFLEEFVHTQMFQCFSIVRGKDKNSSSSDSGNHFFLCASMISQLKQSFDRKTVRKAVQRMQIGDGAPTQRYHPIALQLTSNTAFPGGDASIALTKLCVVTVRVASELERVIHTVQWRLMDSAGLKWRHGYKALLLLRGLIINGPESCVVEALDLTGVVRKMQYYKSGLPPGAGSGSGEHIRSAAKALLPLLVDLGALKRERARIAAQAFNNNLRQNPISRAPILNNIWNKKTTFKQVHDKLKPTNSNVSNRTRSSSTTGWMSVVSASADMFDFDNFVVKDDIHVSSKLDQFADFHCDWSDSTPVPPSPMASDHRDRAPSWAQLPDVEQQPQQQPSSLSSLSSSSSSSSSSLGPIPATLNVQQTSVIPPTMVSSPTSSQSSSPFPQANDWDPFWQQSSTVDPFAVKKEEDPFVDPFANQDISHTSVSSHTLASNHTSASGMNGGIPEHDLLNFNDLPPSQSAATSRQVSSQDMISMMSDFSFDSHDKGLKNHQLTSHTSIPFPSNSNGSNQMQNKKTSTDDPFSSLFKM